MVVHGGGWANDKGDKANARVIANKIACWLARGYMVISINYDLWTSTNGITPLQGAGRPGSRLRSSSAPRPAAIRCATRSWGIPPAGTGLAHRNVASHPEGRGFFLPNGVVCLDSIHDPALAIDTANKTGNKQAIELYKLFGTDRSKWPDESPIRMRQPGRRVRSHRRTPRMKAPAARNRRRTSPGA